MGVSGAVGLKHLFPKYLGLLFAHHASHEAAAYFHVALVKKFSFVEILDDDAFQRKFHQPFHLFIHAHVERLEKGQDFDKVVNIYFFGDPLFEYFVVVFAKNLVEKSVKVFALF